MNPAGHEALWGSKSSQPEVLVLVWNNPWRLHKCLHFKGKSQTVTKVGWQPDCEPALAYNSSGLRLCTCAEVIFPFLFFVAALCLLNFSALVFPFDLFFACVAQLKRLSHRNNLFELLPANFLVLGTFSDTELIQLPRRTVTWECRALLSITKVFLSDYPLAPLKPSTKWSLSFSITSPLAQFLSLSHS